MMREFLRPPHRRRPEAADSLPDSNPPPPDFGSANALVSLTALVCLLALPLFAKPPGDYRVGETVEEDIATPVALRVVDAAATEALRAKEVARVPVIYRFVVGAPEAAERELRASFALTRSNFQQRVQEIFKRRTLAVADLSLPRFQRLITNFARTNRAFPLTTNLAELWATGDTGRAVQNAALAKLRAQQERPLRLGTLSPEVKPGPRALLLNVNTVNEPLTLEAAQKRGRNVARTNVVVLARARTDLTGQFWADEKPIGKFAAGLLRENCHFEAELTELARQLSITNLLAAATFEAGQVIAQRGQVVDARLQAILAELAEKTAASQLAARVSEEQARVERIMAAAEQVQLNADESQALAVSALAHAERARQRNRWLAAGLALATVGVALLSWRLMRRRRPGNLLPARLAGDGLPATVVSCPSCDETIVIPAGTASATDVSWQQRARAAEARAERAQAALKSGAFAQLGVWLKQRFAQRLLTERGQLLDAQKSAATELAELEQRLDELHAPLQERLRAYEKRVVELEKSLAAKGQENRQLLEAKIQLTRKQLETERARSEIQMN